MEIYQRYLSAILRNQPVFTRPVSVNPFICTAAGELLKRVFCTCPFNLIASHTVCCPATVSKNICIIKILDIWIDSCPVNVTVLLDAPVDL
jgi:hypothetical protein